jgi:methyl halide transferase
MEQLAPTFWQQKYANAETPWDIGYASTPIVQYFQNMDNKEMSILIPGCGNAYEAKALAALGFTNITVVDIVPEVIEKFSAECLQHGWNVKAVCADFFTLTQTFDCIVEQTFFCALLTTQRLSYVQKMRQLLQPNGILVGVLFNREFDKAGPPFGGSVAEYEPLFKTYFSSVQFSPCTNSIKPRMGAEVWMECS